MCITFLNIKQIKKLKSFVIFLLILYDPFDK